MRNLWKLYWNIVTGWRIDSSSLHGIRSCSDWCVSMERWCGGKFKFRIFSSCIPGWQTNILDLICKTIKLCLKISGCKSLIFGWSLTFLLKNKTNKHCACNTGMFLREGKHDSCLRVLSELNSSNQPTTHLFFLSAQLLGKTFLQGSQHQTGPISTAIQILLIVTASLTYSNPNRLLKWKTISSCILLTFTTFKSFWFVSTLQFTNQCDSISCGKPTMLIKMSISFNLLLCLDEKI